MLNFKDETNIADLVDNTFLGTQDQPQWPLRLMNYEIEKDNYSYWK
jgi:hypothetical protein